MFCNIQSISYFKSQIIIFNIKIDVQVFLNELIGSRKTLGISDFSPVTLQRVKLEEWESTSILVVKECLESCCSKENYYNMKLLLVSWFLAGLRYTNIQV